MPDRSGCLTLANLRLRGTNVRDKRTSVASARLFFFWQISCCRYGCGESVNNAVDDWADARRTRQTLREPDRKPPIERSTAWAIRINSIMVGIADVQLMKRAAIVPALFDSIHEGTELSATGIPCTDGYVRHGSPGRSSCRRLTYRAAGNGVPRCLSTYRGTRGRNRRKGLRVHVPRLAPMPATCETLAHAAENGPTAIQHVRARDQRVHDHRA